MCQTQIACGCMHTSTCIHYLSFHTHIRATCSHCDTARSAMFCWRGGVHSAATANYILSGAWDRPKGHPEAAEADHPKRLPRLIPPAE